MGFMFHGMKITMNQIKAPLKTEPIFLGSLGVHPSSEFTRSKSQGLWMVAEAFHGSFERRSALRLNPTIPTIPTIAGVVLGNLRDPPGIVVSFRCFVGGELGYRMIPGPWNITMCFCRKERKCFRKNDGDFSWPVGNMMKCGCSCISS